MIDQPSEDDVLEAERIFQDILTMLDNGVAIAMPASEGCVIFKKDGQEVFRESIPRTV